MKKIKSKISEIDIIIEEWLKKIVADKIDIQLEYYDFKNIIKEVVKDKFKEEIKSLKFPNLAKDLDVKKMVTKFNNETDDFWRNILNEVIKDGLRDAIKKFTRDKMNDMWGGFKHPPEQQNEINTILDTKDGKWLLQKIQSLFKWF